MSKLSLGVCLTPALLPLYDIYESIVVVIDIFRATSSICYGIDNGAKAIIPVADIESCDLYRNTDFLLAAERDGEVVEGFDFGNSPFAYNSEKVKGKTIVLTTTNGTRAIQASKKAYKVVIGSFLNIDVLCSWLKKEERNICLLCSGWKDKINLEDTLFAGAVVDRLKNSDYSLDDSGILAMDLYRMAKDDIRNYLKKSSHNKRLETLNIEEDIMFCLQENVTTSIPILKGNTLVKMISHEFILT